MLKYQRQIKEQNKRMHRINRYISKNALIDKNIREIDDTINNIHKEIKQTDEYSKKLSKLQKELSKLRTKRYYLVQEHHCIEMKITKNSC